MRLLAATLVLLAVSGGVTVAVDDGGVAVGSKHAGGDGDLQVDRYAVVWNGSNATGADVLVNNTALVDLHATVTVELRTLDGDVVASASRTVLVGPTAEEVRVSFTVEWPSTAFGRVVIRVEKAV